MKTSTINRKVIGLLQRLSDDKSISVKKNKHIKVTGFYWGQKRVLILSLSPSSNYQNVLHSTLRNFFRSVAVEVDIDSLGIINI